MTNKVTYHQLEKALVSLGFEKVEGGDFTIFKNMVYDALIVLPKGINTTIVRPVHLLVAEKTVTEKGIASSDKFARAIAGVRPSRSLRVRAGTGLAAKSAPFRGSGG